MGKVIDNLRTAIDAINKAFEIKQGENLLLGIKVSKDELDYIERHKELSLLLNCKRPKMQLINEKLGQIKALDDKLKNK